MTSPAPAGSWNYNIVRGFDIFAVVPANDGQKVFDASRVETARFPRSWITVPLVAGQFFDVQGVYVALYGDRRHVRRWLSCPASLRVDYADRLYGVRRIVDLLHSPADGGWLSGVRLRPTEVLRAVVVCEKSEPRVRVQFGMIGTLWQPLL